MKDKFELNKLFLEADDLIKDKKIGEALKLLDFIIKEDPNFGKAHNHIGWIYATALQDSKMAETHYKQAMLSEPTYTASFINYCYILSSEKRFDELKNHLDKIINMNGIDKAFVYNEYSMMYEAQGFYEKSIKASNNAIANTWAPETIQKYSASGFRSRKKMGFVRLFKFYLSDIFDGRNAN